MLLPTPKTAAFPAARLPLPPAILCPPALLPAAQTLAELSGRFFDLPLAIVDSSPCAISFLQNPDLEKDAYRLAVAPEGVTVTAADAASACKGVASLLQLIEDGTVPVGVVEDAPDCAWSSFSLDLSRRFHDFSWLLRYVDLCFLCKIRVLHLHFTDDQGYRLPSHRFPALPAVGAHYSFEQIAELVAYAEKRGVTIMPEIDVPGHCTPFCTAYPEIFGAGPLIDLNERSMQAMKALFGECMAMFPASPFLHIGGDEAAIDAWCDKPDCVAYAAAHIPGFDPALPDRRIASEQMLARFVNELADCVFDAGRQPVAWEGFGACVNDLVRKDLLLYSWENYYQTAPELLRAGFRIINGSWNPNYIVTPAPVWPLKEVYDWSIYRWTPVHPGSPYIGTTLEIEPHPGVIGGALLAWGDRLVTFASDEEAARAEWELVCERMPAVAEHTWDGERKRNWEAFLAAHGKLAVLIGKI